MPDAPDPKLIDRIVEGCAQTHQLLLASVDALDPAAFSAPSRLPGWTRAHVVAHLAFNARSFVHLFACAARGETGDQYPGGPEERARDIDDGATWDPERLVGELRRHVYTLEGAWAGATSETWQGTGRLAGGSVVAMHEIPFRRWRESTVHLTDLDVGIGHEAWSPLYVRLELERQKMAWAAAHPMGLTQLPRAAMQLDENTRLAWLLQRTDVDGLPPGPGI